MIDGFKDAISIIRREKTGEAIVVIVVISIAILFNISPFLAIGTGIIFLLFIIVRYHLNLLIASILVTGIISPTAISQIFLGHSFKPLFSFVGGISIGAAFWGMWILASVLVALRGPGTFFRLVKKNPLHPLFLLYAGSSILFAPDKGEGIQALGRLLVPYSLLIIFYFYLTNEMERKEKEIHTYYDWIAFSIIITGPILFLFGLNPGIKSDAVNKMRYTGIFGVTTNAYIAVCAFFVIYYLTCNIYIQRKRNLMLVMFLI